MGRKVFVGGLPWSVDETVLREHFKQCGTVVYSKVIMDPETGRSKGYGFVEFASEDSVMKAITTLNGQQMEGREITVSEAHDRRGDNSERPARNLTPRDNRPPFRAPTVDAEADNGGVRPPQRRSMPTRRRMAWDREDSF